jgi:hypothetical protein
MIADEEYHSSRSSRLALSEASSATINDSKVRSKMTAYREMERAFPKHGTGFGKTWDE